MTRAMMARTTRREVLAKTREKERKSRRSKKQKYPKKRWIKWTRLS